MGVPVGRVGHVGRVGRVVWSATTSKRNGTRHGTLIRCSFRGWLTRRGRPPSPGDADPVSGGRGLQSDRRLPPSSAVSLMSTSEPRVGRPRRNERRRSAGTRRARRPCSRDPRSDHDADALRVVRQIESESESGRPFHKACLFESHKACLFERLSMISS
jgi:hypothetical protein